MSPRLRWILPACAVVISAAWAAKPDELRVQSIELKREGDLILVDTTVKNTGDKALPELVVIYKFYSPSHEPMSTQRTPIEETVLQPGAESDIHAQVAAPPKAVTVEVSAQAKGGRELRVGNTGPFTIE